MILNSDEMRNLRIIENAVEENYHPLNYDVSVGTILDHNGTAVTGNFVLEPRGVVYVFSKEVINLENKSIIGYATIKTANSGRGILATNIGLVDPNYRGYVSSILLNFGKEQRIIRQGDIFLRLTFHQHKAPIKHLDNLTDCSNLEKYTAAKREFVLNGLGRDFLDTDRLIVETSQKVVSKEILGTWLPKATFYFALVLVLVPLMPIVFEKCFDSYVSPSERNVQDRLIGIEARLNAVEVPLKKEGGAGEISLMRNQLDSLATVVQELKNGIQSKVPSQLKKGS